MPDRLIALLGGLLSLLAIVVLLTPPSAPEPKVSRPTSEDRLDNGLYALKHWLDAGGIPTLSLRRRYEALPKLAPGRGNLLILHLPRSQPPRKSEQEPLREWIADGNHVLALVAAADRPGWARLADTDDAEAQLADWGFALSDEGEPRSLAADPTAVTLTPALAHPLLANVRVVESRAGTAPPRLEAQDDLRLALSLLSTPEGAAFWMATYGGGRLWLGAHSNLFANAQLGAADNAQLFAGLVNQALGPGGRVVFDDFHFGLSEIYDPQAFFKDPRLHHTLLFIGAFWLLYLVGFSNRLAPPAPRPQPIRGADFAEAVAGLFARRLSDQDVARRLLRHFFNDVRRRHGLPPTGEPAWPLLERHAGIDPNTLARLRRLSARRKPPLGEISRLIHQLRKQLA